MRYHYNAANFLTNPHNKHRSPATVSFVITNVDVKTLSQSRCTALGLYKATVTGVWKTVGIPTGHVSS